MIIYIYDEAANRIEKYIRCLNEDMPYTDNGNLTVADFLSTGSTNVMWSTRQFMENVNESLDRCKVSFDVRTGFQRGWQEVQNGFYHFKLGTALEGGESMSLPARTALARDLEASGKYDWIGDQDHEPTVLRFYSAKPSDSDLVPFETIQKGDLGTSVFVLQDTLWALGYCVEALNGEFDEKLKQLVLQFQRDQQLEMDGIVGKNTWEAIMRRIHPEDERLNARIDE